MCTRRRIPGFRSARRFRRVVGGPSDGDGGGDGDGVTTEYLAVYEIEADDIAGPVEEWRRRSAAGETTRTDALQLDPPPVVGLYEELP